MKTLTIQPRLAERVRDAILGKIDQALGFSRQPVQQTLVLLGCQGVLQDAPGRGLQVAPLYPEPVRHSYDIRAMIEGLAAGSGLKMIGAETLVRAHLTQVSASTVCRLGRKLVASGA